MTMDKENVIAINEAKKMIAAGHKLFKAFEKGTEMVLFLEGLEQRQSELEVRIASLLANAEELAACNDAAKAGIIDAKKSKSDILDGAMLAAEKILKDAKEEGDKAKAKAIKCADDISLKIESADLDLKEKALRIEALAKEISGLEKKRADIVKRFQSLGD